MKVFWSWQSDTPGKIGRFVIRDALQDAIQELKQAPDIEEPTGQATREGLHLDHDIKDVKGSPDLARTILDKIDASRVVVADVTIVGETCGGGTAGKKLINSNVAIELGYAYRALGDDNVILTFNAHYGSHEDLPFDLRHKGGAVLYDLAPSADQSRIKEEKKKLAAQFVAKLRPYLQALATAQVPFAETPSTYSKAAYFEKGQVLAELGETEDRLFFSYQTDSICYLRLVPTMALPSPIPLARLTKAAPEMLMLRRGYGAMTGYNEYGAIAYEPGSNPPKGEARLSASTQLFPNGEIWSISASLVVAERGPERPGWIKTPFIHSLTFEQIYYDTLRSLITRAAIHLGLRPPWQVEFGLVGIDGAYVAGMPNNEQWGPIRKQKITDRTVLNDDAPSGVDSMLLRFFSLVYDATGYQRPPGLHGFPPSRPAGGQG